MLAVKWNLSGSLPLLQLVPAGTRGELIQAALERIWWQIMNPLSEVVSGEFEARKCGLREE